MANVVPSPDQLGRRFLSLPRELRDLIYPYIVVQDSPLELTNRDIQAPLDDPVLAAEWLEAVYTYNTCSVTFVDSQLLGASKFRQNLWGTHPQNKRYIRKLIVNAEELLFPILADGDAARLEDKLTSLRPKARQEWNELLEIPRLESLTINLQRRDPQYFTWVDFGPIVLLLREWIPHLCVEFNVSFDKILEETWNNWDTGTPISEEQHDNAYLPMGFVNMDELVAPPSDQDRAHVAEFFPKKYYVGPRDIVRGLLDETPANRRVLAPHYMFREPTLLRVWMAEHYELYKEGRT